MDTFSTRDHTQIAFEYVAGTPPTLIFIHGAYLSSGMWRPQLNSLKGRAHLFVDLRGHGQSETIYPYSVATFAEDVSELLNHLDLTHVTLCGHSLGGMVAQHLAVHRPHRVAKLILADTSYGVRSTRLEALLTDMTTPLLNLTPVTWQANLFARQLGKHSADAKRYVQAEMSEHAKDPKNYREVWRAVVQFDGYSTLSEIHCPTLVMVGAFNEQTHAQAQVMAERISMSSLIHIESAGHMLNWDNAERFNHHLLAFAAQ